MKVLREFESHLLRTCFLTYRIYFCPALAGCFLFAYLMLYFPRMPAAETLLKETFDTLPGALFLTNPKGEVVYANNAMESRTGFSVSEIVGKRPKELWGGNMEQPF